MTLAQALTGIFNSPTLDAAIWGLVTSWGACLMLVLTKRWHGALSMDFTDGIQKFHSSPTPRVGGLPIVLGVLVAWWQAPTEWKEPLFVLFVAGMPAFTFGLAEDITKRVGVSQRLLATMASGLLAWWLSDYSLSRVDVLGVDWLLNFTTISVIFTAFAIGGVANSINIIDGFNGLASTSSFLAFIGFGMIAYQVNDAMLAGMSLILASCVWGFFWINWPLGKIFLGDGGSYFIGFSLAWIAVLLIERNSTVSPFAALIICVHPVTEVIFSIYRRRVKQAHPGHPDRLHFHSLVKRRYIARWFSHLSMQSKNSITGLLVGGMTITAVIVANIVYESTLMSAICFIGLGVGYILLYLRMIRHRWIITKKTNWHTDK
ncbi:MraY family glycosyltransferase [Malikia granosa]|uniref:Glycosyl transferase n=1 Tax=Malikia granosa TaxID=263067 RepID=A0A2S9K4R1_9BURK|nr:glycosyltransferase [Malikia granosa]PRD65443.1 glycosyl transferase [Malikia granosa]